MGSFQENYRQSIFGFIAAICALAGLLGILFSGLAVIDLTFGLNWGWEWRAIPAGVSIALFSYVFWRLALVMHGFVGKR